MQELVYLRWGQIARAHNARIGRSRHAGLCAGHDGARLASQREQEVRHRHAFDGYIARAREALTTINERVKRSDPGAIDIGAGLWPSPVPDPDRSRG